MQPTLSLTSTKPFQAPPHFLILYSVTYSDMCIMSTKATACTRKHTQGIFLVHIWHMGPILVDNPSPFHYMHLFIHLNFESTSWASFAFHNELVHLISNPSHSRGSFSASAHFLSLSPANFLLHVCSNMPSYVEKNSQLLTMSTQDIFLALK